MTSVTLAWQSWHLWDWTGSGGALWPQWTRWSPPPFVGVAGVALGDIHRHFGVAGVALMRLDWLRWCARAAVDAVVAAAVCVAGVALGDIQGPFAWQAWHLVTSTIFLAWQAWHLVTSDWLRGAAGADGADGAAGGR